MTSSEQHAVDTLLSGNFSFVSLKDGEEKVFTQKGLKDLLELLSCGSKELHEAFVADKIIGRGASALMILLGVKKVYTPVLSHRGLDLLLKNGIEVEYESLVDNIINREGTGICPVEQLCSSLETPEECYSEICKFIFKK